MERRACPEWPTILNPAEGCYPLVSSARRPERVFHLALRNHLDRQAELRRMFESLGEYRELDWFPLLAGKATVEPGRMRSAVLAALGDMRPTIIHLQIQYAHSGVTPDLLRELRALADPSCVIIQFDGDNWSDPDSQKSQWWVDLGSECDASLLVNTSYQAAYLAMGVRHPGYWAEACDETVWRPMTPTPGTPAVVFLANDYGGHLRYGLRLEMITQLARDYGARFGVYGNGWGDIPAASRHGFVSNAQEPGIYSAAACALSVSNSDTHGRYSSNRLYRVMTSGAVALVKDFVDSAGLGLEDGRNCYLWHTLDELHAQIERILSGRVPTDRMRERAHAWGLERAASRLPEYLALVDAVRRDR
jgi:hypothetical protein